MRLLRTFAVDPIGVSKALPGEITQRRGDVRQDEVDEAWDEHLHDLLGAPWPCGQANLLGALLEDVRGLLAARDIGFGRGTYGYYSDADGAICRAIWCTALHATPEVVVETGVAHGVTSRIVLEALNRTGRGHLWSIDLPHPLHHDLHSQIGVAITQECRARWTYIEGSSRQRLPSLLTRVASLQMFVHDSLHTARNTVFEMEQAATKMRLGGVMLVDDISTHAGFLTFTRRHHEYHAIICPSADRLGEFGIAVKTANAL